MIASILGGSQPIEVLTQGFARRNDRAETKAPVVDLCRNEVLISLVLLRLADVPDGREIETATSSRSGWSGQIDFRSRYSCGWSGKADFVSNGDVRR